MAAANIVILNASNFATEVTNSAEPVLVDFWAPWCGPCKMLAPVLDELAGEYAGKVKIAKLDIDESRDLAIEHGVQSIPTLALFKGGQKVAQVVGMRPKSELKKLMDGGL